MHWNLLRKAHLRRPLHFILCKFHENIFSSIIIILSLSVYFLEIQTCAYLLSHTSSLSQQHKFLQNVERCVRYLMLLQDLPLVHCAMASYCWIFAFYDTVPVLWFQNAVGDFFKKSARRFFVNSVNLYIRSIKLLRSF